MGRISVAGEVDETALDVGVDEFDMNAVAHVEALEPALQPAFSRRLEEPNPGAFVRSDSDDGVESLSNPAGQQQRRRRLPDPPLAVISCRGRSATFGWRPGLWRLTARQNASGRQYHSE